MSEGLNLLRIQSPCFVLNEQEFKQGVHEFDAALSHHFLHHIIWKVIYNYVKLAHFFFFFF